MLDICSRVGGFLELSISKDDDLTSDFKCGCHFLKKVLASKSLLKLKKVILTFLRFFRPKILVCPCKNFKLASAVKTLISGTTSRYTTFTHIVAHCYHQKFAAATTITGPV
jgi:hypothetical protein